MPLIGRARRRIVHRLRHTYTRVPSVAPDPSAPLDEYGVPIVPATQAPSVPNVRCLFEDDAGQLVRTDHGVEMISTPLLYLAHDDPLKPGDEVRDIKTREGTLLVSHAIAETPTDAAPGGEMVYQTMRLREVTFA